MGGGRGGKKGGKKGGGLSAGQKKARKKLASLGRAPKSFGGPTKAQTMAKNRIAAKTATAKKAASMGATNKSFTSGLPSYSSLTSKTEAKKTFSPKADRGPSFKKSLAMATTPAPVPKVESSKDVATHDKPLFKSVPARLDEPASKDFIDGMLQRNINPSTPGDLFGVGTKLVGGYGLLPSGEHGPYKEGTVSTAAEGSPKFEKKYIYSEKKGWQPFTEKADAGFKGQGGTLVASNNLAGLGIGQPKTTGYTPAIGGLGKMLGFDSTTGTFNQSPGSTGLVGVTGGGLNIGGAGFNQDGGGAASRAINVGRAYGPGVDGNQYARDVLQARFPGASPNSAIFGMDAAQLNQPGGPFAQPGPTPENTPEADYTSYQPGSPYNLSDVDRNATNMMRSGRNLITAPFRALGIDTGLTNRLYPKSNEAIQGGIDNRSQFNVANNRRPVTRRRGGGGGARLPVAQPLTPEEILQPQQVAAAQSGPAYQQAGMDNSRLMQIQNDAYSRQMSRIYNPMEIGGFNPMFRFFGRRGGTRRGSFRKAFRRN